MGKAISSMRVLNSSKKKIEDSTEHVATIEVLAEGARYLCDSLGRATETDTYINLVTAFVIRTFASAQDDSPSQTDVVATFTDIAKGEVEGDHRWCTFEHTIITKQGVGRLPAQKRKCPLANRLAALSEQDALDHVVAFLNLRQFGRPEELP